VDVKLAFTMLAAEEALAHWHPGPSWASTLREPVATLFALPSHVSSWATLAMVLGDTHAAGLCVLACQHARTLERTPVEDDGLKAHEAIAAWELGLGKPDTPGPIRLVDLGEAIRLNRDEMTRWLRENLAPFAGHVERAAMFSLCLAALRVGLVAGPPSPTLAQLCDRTLWRPRVGWLRRLCRIGSDDGEWGGDANGD
jgi:hypothetical protein